MIFGGFNGSAKGVSSGIVDEIFDGTFSDSENTVYGFWGVFDETNWDGFSVGTKFSSCSYT